MFLKYFKNFNTKVKYEKIRSELEKILPFNKRYIGVILTYPPFISWIKNLFNFNSSFNWYGHSGIICSDGKNSKIINISGGNEPLVSYHDLVDYFLTDHTPPGDQQGGIFNRSFLISIKKDVSSNDITKLQDYFKDLKQREKDGKVKYGLIWFRLTNIFNRMFNRPIRGNCAYWTTEGLKHVKLLNHSTIWPTLALVKYFLTHFKDSDKQNMIYLKSLKYREEPQGSFLYPFYGLLYGYSSIWSMNKILSDIQIKIVKNKNEYDLKVKHRPNIRERWDKFVKNMKRYIKI